MNFSLAILGFVGLGICAFLFIYTGNKLKEIAAKATMSTAKNDEKSIFILNIVPIAAAITFMLLAMAITTSSEARRVGVLCAAALFTISIVVGIVFVWREQHRL